MDEGLEDSMSSKMDVWRKPSSISSLEIGRMVAPLARHRATVATNGRQLHADNSVPIAFV